MIEFLKFYYRAFKQYLKIKDYRLLKLQKNRPKYYIIRFEDKMHCGWSVWERVVLFNSIYAVNHHMIPVVDMQSSSNIYLEPLEIGKVNAWDKYYLQPGGVSYEDAINSNSYFLGNNSQAWFDYIRICRKNLQNNEYLRKQYQIYIRNNEDTKHRLDDIYKNILLNAKLDKKDNILGLCLRGTDYRQFNHPKQPTIKILKPIIDMVMTEYSCKAIYIATEDENILKDLQKNLSEYKLINYKAGELKKTSGYVGDIIRETKTADEAAIDYLAILNAMNMCKCLVRGVCGATIVAKYKRTVPYAYINIIDLNEYY